MAYKFDENLKTLSAPGENYKSQWLVELYTYNTSASATDLCICQRKIKHCFFVRNSINGNLVKMGTTCVKDILVQDVRNDANTRQRMKKHIIYMFEKGVYIEIHDLYDYVIKVIIDYMSSITNIEELNRFIIIYRANPIILPLLQNIYNTKYEEIVRKQQIEEERRQREIERQQQIEEERRQREMERNRIEEERRQREIERNRIEEEKKRRAIEEKRILEEKQREIQRVNHEIYIQRMVKYEEEEKLRKQKQQEIQKKIDEEEREYREFQKEIKEKNRKVCDCGLKCVDECICETPIWNINKITSNMYCKRCDKWKCRL
jgi:hypothetical protein